MVLTITKEDERLLAQASGQNRFQLFAEGDRQYFAKVADIQIMFDVDSLGRAVALTLHQGAATVQAKRID